MARPNRPRPAVALGEILVWLLFTALLVPAGFTGWAIGHYTAGGTRTVTVSAPATSTAPATTTAATTAQATTTTAAAGGGAAKGKAVFISSGCGACHTFKAAGTSAKIGPDLDTKVAGDAKTAKLAAAAFVRESIVNPNAYISPGFPKGVMPQNFGKRLGKTQLDELVSFIVGRAK